MSIATIAPWRARIRSVRESHNMTLREVADKMGYDGNLGIIYEFEMRDRKFAPFEFLKWCSVFKLDPKKQTWMNEFEVNPNLISRRLKRFGPFMALEPEVPQPAPVVEATPEPTQDHVTRISEMIMQDALKEAAPVPEISCPVIPKEKEPLPASDILTAGELALSRFRELEKIMAEAEKSRDEYERLKAWLTQGSVILDL